MKKMLLHTCCAPCTSYVYNKLSDIYDITTFFYNPNIHPREEFEKRLHELTSFSSLKSFPVIVEDYSSKQWTPHVKPLRSLGEGSRRCHACYRLRFEETFKKAKELDVDIVGTVLSISPHKDAAAINTIGEELSEKYDIEFLCADFKKNDGFKKSVKLSKKYGFYRQNYCGCIYSKREREGHDYS